MRLTRSERVSLAAAFLLLVTLALRQTGSAGFRKWWEGFFRRQSYPVTPYSLGVFHYLRGDWAGLACWTAEGLRQSEGAYGELYGNLGAALHVLGYLEDARACFLIAIEEVPLFKPEERARLAEGLAAVQKELENHPRGH